MCDTYAWNLITNYCVVAVHGGGEALIYVKASAPAKPLQIDPCGLGHTSLLGFP